MINSVKSHALTLATTLGLVYILCAIFDALFPPYGMLAGHASSSPWPLSGSPIGYLTGFLTFTIAGLVIGAIYAMAWRFWNKNQ